MRITRTDSLARAARCGRETLAYSLSRILPDEPATESYLQGLWYSTDRGWVDDQITFFAAFRSNRGAA